MPSFESCAIFNAVSCAGVTAITGTLVAALLGVAVGASVGAAAGVAVSVGALAQPDRPKSAMTISNAAADSCLIREFILHAPMKCVGNR